MARLTKFDRMPAETRELIGTLRGQGYSIRALHGRLAERGIKVGVSTLAKHCRGLDVVTEHMRESRATVESLLSTLGTGPVGAVAGLNVELLQAAVMELLSRVAAGDGQLGPKDIKLIAEALARLAQASKADVDREIAVRREFARQAAEETNKVAKSAGLSDELVERFRSAILGLPERVVQQ